MNHKLKIRNLVILSMTIITFLIVVGISLGSITNMRINNGNTNVRSDKDLTCYWTLNQTANANVTWFRNGAQNLTAIQSCTSGVECFTSLGSGTVPNNYIFRDDIWTCSVSFNNGASIETNNVSVTITDTPPTQPRIFLSNGTEIINTTVFMQEDSTTIMNVNSTDKDGDPITYVLNDSTYCSINGNTGVLTCTPSLTNFSAPLVVSIRVGADTALASTYQFLTINISPTNHAPYFSPALTNKNFTEGVAFNYVIIGVDRENNFPLNLVLVNVTPFINLTINRTSNTTFVLMLPNNRTVSYAEAKLNYTVYLRLNDTDNLTNNSKNTNGTFILIGQSFNHLPNISYIVYNNASINQGSNLSIYINATDVDNDTLSFSTNNYLYNITYNSSTDYGNLVPNSSFKYAWINITNLSNDYVIYHNFTFTAYDSKDNALQVINIFINNTNDAPVIHDISINGNNTQNNTNLSNLRAYTGVPFRYKVNATDVDDLTYDYNNTGLGTYSTNDSRFIIDSNNGIISFTPDNNSGNFTFITTVTDRGGLSFNYISKIEILPNANPIFTQVPIIINCNEYDATNWPHLCFYNISANVTDPDFGDYVAAYWTNSTFFTINSTTGIINFSVDQSMVGNYSIMLNITDTRGGMSSTTIYVNLNNTNNPPSLEAYIPTQNWVVGGTYWITYDASDLDLLLPNTYENLTFTANITGHNASIFSITKISATEAMLEVTPGPNDEGNYTINVTVTDMYNNKSSVYTTKYIYNVTQPPTIVQIIPSGLPLNDTINNETWVNVFPSFSGLMQTEIVVYENRTYTFNQTSIADNSSYPNHLTYQWAFDDVPTYTTQGYQQYFNFFSNGTHNITFTATDQYGSSKSFLWLIDVIDVDRPPIYVPNSLQNLTVDGSYTIQNYLTSYNRNSTFTDTRFYDPDDDPSGLGYSTDETTSLIFSSSTCPYANFSFPEHHLHINALTIGECLVIFTATDAFNPNFTVSSDLVLINITNISDAPEPIQIPVAIRVPGASVTRPLPIPLPEEIERPKPLQILTPTLVTTYMNETIKIPIVINNTWNDTLLGITLEATTNVTNVSLYLDRIYIAKLNKGESVDATLYVKNYKSEGHYEIQLLANVTVPNYQDTATIYINSAEMKSEGEALESKISFAQDLLSSNPECQELNELLGQAKIELTNENYAGTAKIVDNVINGCKYLVNNAKNNKETPDRNFVKTFEWNKTYNDYIILFIFGMLFIASLVYIMKKDNPEKNI